MSGSSTAGLIPAIGVVVLGALLSLALPGRGAPALAALPELVG